MKLAIVEDEVILTMALTLMLEGWGHEVVGTADSEAGAATLVGATRPDAVLMDVRLGRRESGVVAARLIRRDLDVPIVFCTACADNATVQAEVRALGNTHLIGKPVDEERLDWLLRSIEQRALEGAPAFTGRSPVAVAA